MLSIEPLTESAGAIVRGVSLSEPVPEDLLEQLRLALHERGVLFFRGQEMEASALAAFGLQFGPLFEHPLETDDERGSRPVVRILTGAPASDAHYRSTGWHSDASFAMSPPYVGLLHALEVPAVGGDTIWSNMSRAYAALPAEVQARLVDLEAVHDPRKVMQRKGLRGVELGGCSHPVVTTDPLSGRRALYVNENYTSHVVGMSEVDSRELLAYLFAHSTRPEFCVRFRWRRYDVALWHERLTLHYGVGDYRSTRLMRRVVVGTGAEN